jgi:PAS domain S-box-containing protein
MKLNAKIMAAFLPGAVLATIIIGRVVYPSLEAALRKSIGDSHMLLIQQNLNTIDRLMNDKHNDIQTIARENVFLDRLKGRESGQAAARKIEDWLSLSGPWDLLMVTDAKGVVRLSSGKGKVGRRASEDPEDARALAQALKRSIYYSDLVSAGGNATVVFAAPIIAYDEPDQPVMGAVIAHLTWFAVTEILADISEQSHERLFNKNGFLIGSDDPQERASILRSKGSQAALLQGLQGKSGMIAMPVRKGEEEKLMIYAPQLGYLNYKGQGWTLTAEMPMAHAFGPIKKFARTMVAVLSLCIGFSFWAAIVIVMRTISRPIASFISVVREVARGDCSRRVDVSSRDEIGELAAAFNQMVEDLNRTSVSKDFFNDILENIKDQLIVTDEAGLIKLVNPAVVNSLGYTREELIGMPAAKLFHEEVPLFSGPLNNMRTHFLTKTNERILILFSVSVLKAADERVTGFIAVAKDIRELEKLEARMQQSEKLSAVGQLAAGVAHEINNPLGVILGFAQGMSRELQAEDALSFPIKSIEREALRCKALVQSLLTFARTSLSDRVAMDVNDTVTQALALIEPSAKIGRVSLSAALGKGLPPVLGNKSQLEQVIMNLAKNALDAMPNGGVLTLSTELIESAPQSWVCLRFVDNGMGIPADVISKIFDPFFTTKPIGQGTGLGLSLVSEIVQKHSGEISVESRPGRTEFTLKLPARTGRELEKRVEELRGEKIAACGLDGKGTIAHRALNG